MATISLVSQHEISVKKQNHYHNILVSDINSKIANTVPSNAKITKVVLRVNTKVSSSLPMCELYCYLGNNAGTDSNNTNLGKKSGDLPTSAKDYDWDLTSYFNSAGHNTHPFTMNTSSTYLIPFWLNDYIFSFKITCKVDLVVDYETPVTVTATVSPEGAGSVTGCGSYWRNDYVTLEAIENEGHKFKHWLLTADGFKDEVGGDGDNLIRAIAVELSLLNIVAVFEKLSYTVKFVNYDGTVLQTSTVEHGSTPSYIKATPTKPATAQYTYTFSGWKPSIGAISGDTTYTAQFTATKRKYTINFVNYDNSPLETKEVEYGVKPTYTGATPKKSSDAQYDYVFSTWTPSIVAVTGAATYKAVFNSVVRYYTISVIDGIINLASGNLADGKYSYGSILKIIANEKVGYKFVNWSGNSTSTEKEISHTVTSNASFVANYRRLQMKFKSVKILHHSTNETASPTNPLIGGEDGDQAIIKVEIALE